LEALWPKPSFPLAPSENGFQPGDYFQHTITATPADRGLGTRLLEFIAANRAGLGFVVNNIYSTNPKKDGTPLKIAGKALWEKLVRQQKAIFHTDLNHYQLLWQD